MLSYLVLAFALVSAQALQPPTPSGGKEHSQQRDTQGKPPQRQPQPALQGTQAYPLWVKVVQTEPTNQHPKPIQTKPTTALLPSGGVTPTGGSLLSLCCWLSLPLFKFGSSFDN